MLHVTGFKFCRKLLFRTCSSDSLFENIENTNCLLLVTCCWVFVIMNGFPLWNGMLQVTGFKFCRCPFIIMFDRN